MLQDFGSHKKAISLLNMKQTVRTFSLLSSHYWLNITIFLRISFNVCLYLLLCQIDSGFVCIGKQFTQTLLSYVLRITNEVLNEYEV